MRLRLHNPLKHIFITQGFGKDTAPEMLPIYQKMGLAGHNGLDYFASDGKPIYATHDGRVTFAGYDGSGGLGVVIRTNEEFESIDGVLSYWKSISWHLKKDTLLVTGGQQVVRGQQIAQADNTGMSTGPHLHFGLKPIANGENNWIWYNLDNQNGYHGAQDPTPYFVKFQNEMKLGEQGYDVRDLQDFLFSLGYLKVKPTAFYGSLTANAVLEFQKKYCQLSWYERYVLRGTKVGPKTLARLNEIHEQKII